MSQGASIPQINRGDHLFTWKWKLTVDPLYVNCQSAPDQQRWLSLHWLSITSTLIIDPPPSRINRDNCLYINCWLPLCQLPLCQSLIHPQDQQKLSPLHWLSITSRLIIHLPPPRINRGNRLYVDRWSPPPTDFRLTNLLFQDALDA